MVGRQVEVGAGNAKPMVGRCDVGPPVALGAAQCLAQDRHQVGPVHGAGAAREERAEHGVGEQPAEEVVDGGGQGAPPADRPVDADRLGGRGRVADPGA
jgi:hypothetical protein